MQRITRYISIHFLFKITALLVWVSRAESEELRICTYPSQNLIEIQLI